MNSFSCRGISLFTTHTVMNSGGCALPLNDREWCRCWADHHQSRWDEAAPESRITPIPSFLRARVSSCSTHTPKHTLKARLCERGDKNKTLVWQMVTNLQDVLRFVPFVRPFLGQLQHLRQKNVHMTVCHNQHLNSSLEIHTAFISKKFAKKSLLFSTLWVIFQCMKMSSFRTSLYSATASAERRVYKSCCYVIMKRVYVTLASLWCSSSSILNAVGESSSAIWKSHKI